MAQSDLQAHLKKKSIYIDNIQLEVADASVGDTGKPNQEANEQVRRSITVNFLQGRLLKKLKEELLAEIETTHSVTIRVSKSNPAKLKPRKEKDPHKKKDKSKVIKNKGEKKTGKELVDSTVSFQGKTVEDVSRAIEEFSQSVLHYMKLQPVSLKCPHAQLLQVALPQVKVILRDASNYIAYYFKCNENEIKITLCGYPAILRSVESHLLVLHESLTVNESLKIPGTFNLDLPALQAEYDVIINHNKQTGQLQVFGIKDCVAQFVDNINSTLNSAAQEGVKLERGPFLFLQQCVFSDPQWQTDLKAIGAEVTPGANCIVVVKGTDQKSVKAAKQKLINTKQSISEKKVLKPVPKYMVAVLERYAKNKLKGALVLCNIAQDEEDSDDDSDDDDDASVSSFSSDSSKKKKDKKGRIPLQNVEICVWYQKPQEDKVAKTLASIVQKPIEIKKVKYGAEEQATVKNLKLQAVGDKHMVNVFNNMRDKNIVVNGFSRENVLQACDAVEKLLGRNENKETTKAPKKPKGPKDTPEAKAKDGKAKDKEGKGKDKDSKGKEAKGEKQKVKGKDKTGKAGENAKEKGNEAKRRGRLDPNRMFT
eukprot:Phypoly_transcript_05283.p1 GENE.Phypoly_transcript_05283~~Phypoly_transcript_05283.p1  ORF type:complete len:631 (+),score=142.99 Phypoly_transcript_05283:112-1893(+)